MKFFRFSFILILLILFLFGCSDDDSPSDIKISEEFKLITEAGDGMLSGELRILSGEELYSLLQANPNDYYLIDERDLNTFATGYIQGATRKPYTQLIDAETKSVDLPKDKTIVCICYSGQKSAQVASFLSMIGYDTITLKYGMCSWSTDPLILNIDKWAHLNPLEANLETEGHQITDCEIYDFPEITTEQSTAEEIITSLAYDYFYNLVKMVTASNLMENTEDYFIIDLRNETHYNNGHIPGSYRVAIDEFGYDEKLKYLPTDKKIAVVSYTSHEAHYLSCYLNIIGYDSYALKFGMNAITSDVNICGYTYISPVEDLPVEGQRTLSEVIESAEPFGIYDKYVVLQEGKTYTGGFVNGKLFNPVTYRYDLGEEGQNIRIVGNGAILDLQGEELKTSFNTKRLDVHNCIVINGCIKYHGDTDRDNGYEIVSPIGFVKNCTFYQPEKYGVRISGAGDSILVSGNIFYEAQDMGFDLDPYTDEPNNGLLTGINCAFSTKGWFWGEPEIRNNWSYHSGGGRRFHDFAML